MSGELTVTFRTADPNSSPTICAIEVSRPWPISTLLVSKTADPSALRRTLADDVVGVVVLLIVTASPLPRTRLFFSGGAACSSFPFQPIASAVRRKQSVTPTETSFSPVTKISSFADQMFQA